MSKKFNIIEFANKTREIDDALGRTVDYEGGEHGPTFYLWQQGEERWRQHCARQIELHEKALKHWQRGLLAQRDPGTR